jgi:hypothetical protein
MVKNSQQNQKPAHTVTSTTCESIQLRLMNPKLVYESDRLFSVFGYSMSHGLLLLRGGKSNETPATRMAILFQGVRAETRAQFRG